MRVGPEELGIPKLLARVGDEQVTEVILALNATVEGQTTAHYIAEALEGTGARITSLAQGVPDRRRARLPRRWHHSGRAARPAQLLMGTSPETADFFREQAGPGITLRRMFGEYAVQAGGKTLGLLCDDALFVRQRPEITAFLGDPVGGPALSGRETLVADRARRLGRGRLVVRSAATCWEETLPRPRAQAPARAQIRPQGLIPPPPGSITGQIRE